MSHFLSRFSLVSHTHISLPNQTTKTYGCTHGLVQMVHRGRGTRIPGNKWERHLHQNMNIFKTPTKSQCTLFWNQGQHNTEFKHCFGAQSRFRDLTLHWAQKQNKAVEVSVLIFFSSFFYGGGDWDGVLLCSSGWLETHCVDQATLNSQRSTCLFLLSARCKD